MTEQRHEARLLGLMVLLGLWLAAFGFSVHVLIRAARQSSPDISAFWGWQGIAGIFALAIWALGRGLPKDAGARRIIGVPLVGTLTVVLLAVGQALLGPTS
jgi:hypothetical protein